MKRTSRSLPILGHTCLLLQFLILSIASYSQSKTMKSEASEVTVFLHGAQVVRYAEPSLSKGLNNIIITGISPEADINSLQVLATDGVTILEVKPTPNHESTIEANRKADDLLDSLEMIRNKMELKKVELQALNHQETFLMANSRIKGNTTLSAEQFKASNAFYSSQITNVLTQKHALKKELDEMNARLSFLNNKMLKRVKTSIDAELHLFVSVQSPRALKTSLRISYFVKQAGWKPSYDIRVDNLKSPLNLVYKAQVYQNTKEDWSRVKMTFSNANPVKSGNLPTINPYYLYYGRYYSSPARRSTAQSYLGIDQTSAQGRVTDQYGEGVPFAEVKANGSGFNTFTDLEGYFSLQMPSRYRNISFSAVGYKTAYQNSSNQFMQIRLSAVNLGYKGEEDRLDGRYGKLTEKKMDNVSTFYNYDKDGLLDYFDSESLNSTAYANGIGEVDLNEKLVYKNSNSISKNKMSSRQAKSYGYNAGQVTQPEINQTTVDYALAERISLASGEAPKNVILRTKSVQAYYEYRTVPKLEEAAFLIAQIADWSKLNLLEGEANIYFENAFTGKSVLDVKYLSDTLDISLGRDESIVVKREKSKSFSGNKLVGKNTVAKRKFDLSIRNGKNQAINIIIYDQLPVSTLKSIDVKVLALSNARRTKNSGKLEWKITLQPSMDKKLSFSYQVEYDEGKVINLE